ncbi:hypothetical protein F5Y11DRAFT_25372 [Daldinia sp. FL1419]|nr:hypothetical protein F5Y11DRAFT_25372 [Daldinia sp. FL1419]
MQILVTLTHLFLFYSSLSLLLLYKPSPENILPIGFSTCGGNPSSLISAVVLCWEGNSRSSRREGKRRNPTRTNIRYIT